MTQAAPILTLQVVAPSREPPTPLATAGRHWIGRAPDCALVLDEQSVSRQHVCIAYADNGFIISDHSSNGTIVEQAVLRQASRIVAGSVVTLGVGPFIVQGFVPERASSHSVPEPHSVDSIPSFGRLQPEPSEQHQPLGVDDEPAKPPSENPPARREIHKKLLDYLDLGGMNLRAMDPASLRPIVEAALRRILTPEAAARGETADEGLVRELADEALGLGPLEPLLHDPDISEIMVVDRRTIFVEKCGRIERRGLSFTDDDSVRAVIERIVTPLGRRIDESTPLVDARLADGSRVNAVIPPLALRGPCITIRKFSAKPLSAQDLVRNGSLNESMARFIHRSVQARKNILIAGGTGSGKTTLLNVMSAAIPAHERIVTVEDAAELRLNQDHVVALEGRPPNLEGKGEYTIRDLVKNALRMRPDRIIVGECRGGEAIDMLQAMNTGHEGSLTTIHANNPRQAVSRLETLCLMAGLDLPGRAIRQQIARSLHLIVQQARFSDGSRRVTSITEVVGIDDHDDVELRELFYFDKSHESSGTCVRGQFVATGYLPTFLGEFIARGIAPEEVFA